MAVGDVDDAGGVVVAVAVGDADDAGGVVVVGNVIASVVSVTSGDELKQN